MATVAPSIFKSHILRNNLVSIWKRNVSPLRPLSSFTHFPLLPLSNNLHLPPQSLQIHRQSLLSHPLIPLVLRPRTTPMSSLASPPDSNPSKTVRVVIKGRVQGVFYRNWTVDNATDLGLKGWVRNRRDGSVEALFSGTPEKVSEMEQRCRRGPREAMVTALDVFPSTDDPGTGFERRSTV